LTLRDDWESIKDEIMYTIVKDKFVRNEEAKELLLFTGSSHLYEGNTWGDEYWGTVNGKGKNKLGLILERVRSELFKEEKTENGFFLCEWDNRQEQDQCEKCHCVPNKIYYRRTSTDCEDGEYWCLNCVNSEIKDNERSKNEN